MVLKVEEKCLPPPPDVILINYDTAVLASSDGCGLGFVVRDYAGKVFGAQASYLNGISSVEIVEAMALRCGLFMAKELKCKNFWVSSDCSNVVNCLKNKALALEDWHIIIEDVTSEEALATVLMSFTLLDQVPHRIAQFSLIHHIYGYWYGDVPSCVLADFPNPM
ncbi:hypothetical protein POM88_001532 [Heracleum sosnowskyi]|uniref:RNase H type-1 domain-containing protein n=1 Tax=Heracleum sosnowskyi TaxID=360622 RepID=A0AAD8NAH9_9APIA|nr:hypothetical protein POM88_001532 [Heracleum sosnowskyi]